MDYTTLGRTGLEVSVAGLGCGGFSRLGLKRGKTEEQAADLVRLAVDLGVNFIDTAANYGTEGAVGKAMKTIPRDRVVISTKASPRKHGEPRSPEDMVASLDNSLGTIGVDVIDVFHVHGVRPDEYDHVRNALAPALLKERDKGKFRHLGITETPPKDLKQETLRRAVDDPLWEVMMVGFHMMHQKPRQRVFPHTIENDIGTLMMFVVRETFGRPERVRETVRDLAAKDLLPREMANEDDPLGFLIHDGGADSLTDAAYRFARHEPGVDVVLFGTGNPDHLAANVDSILRPPLPEADIARLYALFGHLEGVGLDAQGIDAPNTKEHQ